MLYLNHNPSLCPVPYHGSIQSECNIKIISNTPDSSGFTKSPPKSSLFLSSLLFPLAFWQGQPVLWCSFWISWARLPKTGYGERHHTRSSFKLRESRGRLYFSLISVMILELIAWVLVFLDISLLCLCDKIPHIVSEGLLSIWLAAPNSWKSTEKIQTETKEMCDLWCVNNATLHFFVHICIMYVSLWSCMRLVEHDTGCYQPVLWAGRGDI